MRNYLWTFVAVLPLAGCTTVETTAFAPITLPGGCVVGDNYPTCKSLNATCSTPISVTVSDDDDFEGETESDSEGALSNCNNLFSGCMDELAASGFIGTNPGQCVPQEMNTENVQGTLSNEVLGNIWYLNCSDDKTAGIQAFEAMAQSMPNTTAFTAQSGSSFVGESVDTNNNAAVINEVVKDGSGSTQVCSSNISGLQSVSGSNLGLSQVCVSDFGSNLGNYKNYLGSDVQSTVDYNNLPSAPTCKPLPPGSTTTINTNSQQPGTPFTGVTVGVGYTNSTTLTDGTTVTGNNGTVSIGYTVPLQPTTIGNAAVTPTIGVNTGITIGNQGTVAGTPGTTTTTGYYDYVTVTTPGTTDRTPVSNTIAVVAQPGLIINNSVQVYANIGGVIAGKQADSSDYSPPQTTAFGTRVGVGAGVAVTNNISLNVQGNSDNVSGTRVNSVGVGLQFTGLQ